MNRVELEDCLFKLGQVFELYDKKVRPGAARIWEDVFREHEKKLVIAALDELARTSAYAPKPAQLEEILSTKKRATGEHVETCRSADPETKKAFAADQNFQKQASEQVASAWAIYFELSGSILGGKFKPRLNLSRERALEIVNEQAKKYNNIEAILPEYRIPSILYPEDFAA